MTKNGNSVDISGLSKAVVLAGLYNGARPQGLGFAHYDPEPMSIDVAFKIIDEMSNDRLYFDYVNGRVLKVDITQDSFDPYLYDRDNGQGSAESIITELRSTDLHATPNGPVARLIHARGTLEALDILNEQLGDTFGDR